MLVRELDLETLVLERGSHPHRSGMCVMEAVAFIAGEQWGDRPQCACPVISAFLRKWNDDLDDAGRDRLKHFIPRVLGTRNTKAVETTRAWLVADWTIRASLPAWLDVSGMAVIASAVRSLPEMTDLTRLIASQALLKDVRAQTSAVESAARSAARSPVKSATRSATRSAVWSAVWSAVESAAVSAAESARRSAAVSAAESAAVFAAESLAWSATWSAVKSATRSATRRFAAVSAAESAAESAAVEKLWPTVVSLQASAMDLIDRLIACGGS